MDGAFALGFVALVLAFGLALLNARDRRRDRTASVVLCACATPALRGLIALRVRAPLLSRRTVAFLDMLACAAADVWPTMRRDRGSDVSEPDNQPPTHPYHRWVGVAPSSRNAIFIRVR